MKNLNSFKKSLREYLIRKYVNNLKYFKKQY